MTPQVLSASSVASPSALRPDQAADYDSLPTMQVPSLAQQLPPVAEGRTRMYLCRHGQTEFNRLAKYQGRGVNMPLNSTGRLQAACLAQSMRDVPLRAIYSSSLHRARETAATVAQCYPQLPPPEQFRDLEEMSFGVMEGEAHATMGEQVLAIHAQWRNGDYSARFPSGECPLDVVKRGVAQLDALLQRAGERDQDHVLVVTHGRFNKVVLAQLLYGGLERMHDVAQDNTCVNVLDYVHATRTYEAVALNHTGHLQPLESCQ